MKNTAATKILSEISRVSKTVIRAGARRQSNLNLMNFIMSMLTQFICNYWHGIQFYTLSLATSTPAGERAASIFHEFTSDCTNCFGVGGCHWRDFFRFESLIILRVRSQFVRFKVSLAGGVIDIHLNEIRWLIHIFFCCFIFLQTLDFVTAAIILFAFIRWSRGSSFELITI